MKIIHTADWHLGNTFHRHGREAEHQHFLEWLLATLHSEQPDALVVAGDVFDSSNPPAWAVRQLYSFFNRATAEIEGLQIIMIAGNHDGGARLEAPAELLSQHRINMRGIVQRDENGRIDFSHYVIPLHSRTEDRVEALCLAIPFLRTSDYPEGYTAAEGIKSFVKGARQAAARSRYAGVPLVAVAHFYATGAEVCENEHSERLVIGGQDCVDIDSLGEGLSYVALGHIHKAQRVSGHEEIRYAGSPIALSFSEKNYKRSVMRVEINADGTTNLTPIEYEPLRPLVSIPATGSLLPEQVLDAVKKLPVAAENDNGDAWPYVELRIQIDEPNPALLNDVLDFLSDKAVHYCRIVRVSRKAVADDDDAPQSLESLQHLAPIDLAKKVFHQRYNADMPESMEKLLDSVIHEIAVENRVEENN